MAQLRSLAVITLLAIQSHAERTSNEQLITEAWQRTEKTVRTWMRTHAGNDPDEEGMAELKATNPDAFAIVQALMTKRSLGLLNPAHPMSSMKRNTASAQDDSSADDAVQSPESQHGPSMSLEATAVAPQPHRDWLNWKPADSAADDDAMVQGVLGEVASATQGQQLAALSHSRTVSASTSSELSSDETTLSSGSGGSEIIQHTAAAPQHASGMSSFDWGNPYSEAATSNVAAATVPASPTLPAASTHEENKYLKGLDLDNSINKAADGPNKLASFSWSTALVQQKANPVLVQQRADRVSPTVTAFVDSPSETANDKVSMAMGWGALGNWLGNSGSSGSSKQPALVQEQEHQPAAPVNKYLDDLRLR